MNELCQKEFNIRNDEEKRKEKNTKSSIYRHKYEAKRFFEIKRRRKRRSDVFIIYTEMGVVKVKH
jgi:hypothetical protein